MKHLTIILFILTHMIVSSQQNVNKMVLTEYIMGKPHMKMLEIRKELAKHRLLDIKYVFGDGAGGNPIEIKLFERENKATYEYLEKKYGKNWDIILYKEACLNLNQWSVNVTSDSILVANKLRLQPRKKAHHTYLQFNTDRTFVIYKSENDNSDSVVDKGTYMIDLELLEMRFANGDPIDYNYQVSLLYELKLNRKK